MSVSTTDVLPLFRQSTHQTMKPQWPTIFKLVDLVTADTRRGAALLVPHIQKQLKDKDPVCVFLTLCVLEACMKYCGTPFHEFVAHPIFMKEMKALVKKRYTKRKSALTGRANFKNLIGQKAARLIRQWGVGYHEKKLKYRTFYTTYMQLLRKGVQFPYGEDDSVPEKPNSGDYDKVESKKDQAGKKKGKVPLRVKTEVSESREAIKRLREVFKDVKSAQQARNSDIANNIAARLVKKQETMTTLVNEFMGNEVALDLLLNVNGEISSALAFYKKKRGESVEDDDMSDASEVSDVGEESVREGEFDALHNSRAKQRQQNNPLSNQKVANKARRKPKAKKASLGVAATNPFDMFNTAPTPSTTTGSSLLMDMNPLQPRPITNRAPANPNPQQPGVNVTPFMSGQSNGHLNTQLHHTNIPNVAPAVNRGGASKFKFSVTHGNVFNTNPTPAQGQQYQQFQQQQFRQQQIGQQQFVQQPFMSQPYQSQFASQPMAVPQSQFGNQMYNQQPKQPLRAPNLAQASTNWSSSPAMPTTVGSAPPPSTDLFSDLNPL